mgnify:CR=1 FL=1
MIKKQSKEHILKRINSRWKNGNYGGKKHSEEHREKISESCKKSGCGKWSKGTKHSEETKLKMSIAQKGRIRSKWIGQKISLAKRGKPNFNQRGENHPRWKGGIEKENVKIRKSLEMTIWRRAVYERDNYTCRFCGQHGGKLEVDHIKPFSLFPELRFAIDNGRTLCKECHRKTDTYGGRVFKLKVQTV